MKKWFSGISIIVMLMIVFSSIIQFHHHDDKGNIVFAVTALCCQDAHHQDNNSCCHSEHKCHDNECESSDVCSAHLGDYQATKQTDFSIEEFPILLLHAILSVSIDSVDSFASLLQIVKIEEYTASADGVYSMAALRAPPVC